MCLLSSLFVYWLFVSTSPVATSYYCNCVYLYMYIYNIHTYIYMYLNILFGLRLARSCVPLPSNVYSSFLRHPSLIPVPHLQPVCPPLQLPSPSPFLQLTKKPYVHIPSLRREPETCELNMERGLRRIDSAYISAGLITQCTAHTCDTHRQSPHSFGNLTRLRSPLQHTQHTHARTHSHTKTPTLSLSLFLSYRVMQRTRSCSRTSLDCTRLR